jgi:hypothetical protein
MRSDNTYADRRNSMMSVDPALYHGGSGLQDVTTLHPSGVSTSSDAAKQAVFMGDDPAVANEFARLASQKKPVANVARLLITAHLLLGDRVLRQSS